jgi:hypothetical protein
MNEKEIKTLKDKGFNEGIQAAIKLVEERGEKIRGAINPRITIKALEKLLKEESNCV